MAVEAPSPAVIAAVVLAAGNSARFGSDKRRYRVADNNDNNDGNNYDNDAPLLQRALAKPLSLAVPTYLVLKPADKQRLPALLADYQHHPALTITYAELAANGMGHSLAHGIAQLPPVDGALIVLADMPWINRRTFEQLIANFAPGKIIVPRYQLRDGHPVLFASDWFNELTALSGDTGAKAIIRDHPEQVVYIDVDDEGIARDLDRPLNE